MIDKRVNVAKRLKDYKDILEAFVEEADNEAHYRIDSSRNIAYYEGKAAAYRIALTFFKEYLEKIVVKKERS